MFSDGFEQTTILRTGPDGLTRVITRSSQGRDVVPGVNWKRLEAAKLASRQLLGELVGMQIGNHGPNRPGGRVMRALCVPQFTVNDVSDPGSATGAVFVPEGAGTVTPSGVPLVEDFLPSRCRHSGSARGRKDCPPHVLCVPSEISRTPG
jgi:hypothetical protein